MKFDTLYTECLGFWPDELEIFDGEKTDDGGMLFLRLSLIYDRIDAQVKPLGEWYELMTWVIFKNLHAVAKKRFGRRVDTISKIEIDADSVKADLLANLQSKGYEKMLAKFEE